MVCNCSFPVVSPSVATRSARVGSFKAPIAELVASSSRCKPVVRTRLRGESENVESFCARAYANSFLANNVECPSPRFKKVRALRQRRYDCRNGRMKSHQHARRLSLAGQWPGKTDVLPSVRERIDSEKILIKLGIFLYEFDIRLKRLLLGLNIIGYR